MQETVLISMPVDELQKLIIDSVNTCLKYPSLQLPKEKFLTENEAAEFLEIPFFTLQDLIKKCEIPIRIKGKRCYFSKHDLVLWKQAEAGGSNA